MRDKTEPFLENCGHRNSERDHYNNKKHLKQVLGPRATTAWVISNPDTKHLQSVEKKQASPDTLFG